MQLSVGEREEDIRDEQSEGLVKGGYFYSGGGRMTSSSK